MERGKGLGDLRAPSQGNEGFGGNVETRITHNAREALKACFYKGKIYKVGF